MNENRMNDLLAAARKERAPEPAPDFAADVMRSVRQLPEAPPLSALGQLGELFPRLALAAALIMVFFVVGDFCASAIDQTDFAGGVTQLSEQWLFAARGF